MAQEHKATQPMTFCPDPDLPIWQSIHTILNTSREAGVEDPVARHLVGANLQLAFPNLGLRNDTGSPNNTEINQGDFRVGDTAFHVTVTPISDVYERCKKNIEDGLRAYLLVPERIAVAAKYAAETLVPAQIMVQSIESFVGQNIDELSAFSKNKRVDEFRRLLETYNQRVDAIETDKSMLIEIPRNLRH